MTPPAHRSTPSHGALPDERTRRAQIHRKPRMGPQRTGRCDHDRHHRSRAAGAGRPRLHRVASSRQNAQGRRSLRGRRVGQGGLRCVRARGGCRTGGQRGSRRRARKGQRRRLRQLALPAEARQSGRRGQAAGRNRVYRGGRRILIDRGHTMAMNEPGPGPSAHPRSSLRELEQHRGFVDRHIGTDEADQAAMLRTLGFATRGALIDAIVPAAIRRRKPLALPAPKGEEEALEELRSLAAKNRVYTTYIGQRYYGTYTPGVILRNVLENPAWYTAYTPYQPEISQGRLEALVNFQTMICDLSGMAIANASMLDEATAAAEAMTLALRVGKSASRRFFVADDVFAQTLDVVRTRAAPLGIDVVT